MRYPKIELIKYRLERARKTIYEAKAMAKIKHYNTSVNRLYYACFYAVSALLLQYNLSSSKHSGVRSFLNKEFIKTGKIPLKYGELYNDLYKYREQADYEDLFEIKEELIAPWLDQTEEFITLINKMITNQDL